MTPLRKTNVLVASASLHRGGAERVSVDIANTLDRDEFTVAFCSTPTGGPLEHRLRGDGELSILHRAATWDLRKLPAFADLVRRHHIDVVHSHGRGTMKFVALAAASCALPVRHVFHDHFGMLHLDRGADAGLRIAMRSRVDAYLGVDDRLCRWAVREIGLPAPKVHLVRSGVDLSRFADVEALDVHREFRIPADRVAVVAAANFRPQKDYPTLFLAMAELAPSVLERMHLVICGDTTSDPVYFERCSEMVDRLGLTERVTVAGTRDDLPAVLAGADAAVLSSKNETGPLVVLEYMASGLPFVATDTGEVTRAVRGLDVGFVPAPRDHHDLADALAALLTMTPEERRAMGERGRAAARDRFSQDLVTRQIEHIYEAVLRGSGGPEGQGPGRVGIPSRPE